MSRTKKGIGLIVIALALVALVAAGIFFPQAESGGGTVVSGDGAAQVSLRDVNAGQSDYNYGVHTDVSEPGEVASTVTQGTAITNAAGLNNALKTNGTYYLANNINFNAYTGASDAAVSGTFGGMLYGNGYTVTVTVPANTSHNWGSGDYGFLVSNLSGTIRDLNVVVNGAASGWTYFGPNTSTEPGSATKTKNTGGITGSIKGGVVYNCTVTFGGSIAIVQNNGGNFVPGASRGWSTSNINSFFGGVAGWSSGGTVANTTVNYNGKVANVGQKIGYGGYRLFVVTGGIIGNHETGTMTLNKVTVQGSGYVASEANMVMGSGWPTGSTGGAVDVYTGGLVGYTRSALAVNGAYINLTQNNTGGETNP